MNECSWFDLKNDYGQFLMASHYKEYFTYGYSQYLLERWAWDIQIHGLHTPAQDKILIDKTIQSSA